MTRLVPAVTLAAALGIGAASPAAAQEPGPPPIVLPAPGAGGRVPATTPDQPTPPTKVVVAAPESPAMAAPGEAVGRVDEPAATAEQRRGGRRGGSRARPGAPIRRPAPVVVPRRGWGWHPSPVYIARPYYYDPFWVSGAFGWSPLFYAPWSLMWSTAGYGPYPYIGPTAFSAGGVRLKIKPRDAEVFVDGFYAGVVDEFDGIFQSLRLAPGGHKVEVRMPGFESLDLDIHIQPDRTMTVEKTLRPANP